MSIYRPTYLYIKQHSITGKLYFGKTTQNPETYLGSGLHWQRHIKKHGKEHVVNLWYHLFENQKECMEFAIDFSNKMNIVESNQWLNLKQENGLDGSPAGLKFSHKHRENLSKSKKPKYKFQDRIYINNNIIELRIRLSEFEKYKNIGFKIGYL